MASQGSIHPSMRTGEMAEKLQNFQRRRRRRSSRSTHGTPPSVAGPTREPSLSQEAVSHGTLSTQTTEVHQDVSFTNRSTRPRRQPTLLTSMGYI